MVRLKVVNLQNKDYVTYEFQFHSGSIKSRGIGAMHEAVKSFNSIVVRLKGNRMMAKQMTEARFNSIVVRLKVPMWHKKTFLCSVSIP